MAKKGTKSGNGQSTLDLPNEEQILEVKFGGLSIGESTARLGVAIGRGAMTLSRAEKLLCERRLSGSIELGGLQGQLPGMQGEAHTIVGVFDTKALSVKSKYYATGLTLALEEIDVSDLAHFPKREGVLRISEISAIPEKKRSTGNGEDEDDDEEEHPDVAAGKDRPHGTPALEAAARAKAAKQHYCASCEHRWPFEGEKAAECPECGSTFDVELVGYGGDPGVNDQGIYVAGLREVDGIKIRKNTKHALTIWSVQGADGRWRTECEYEADGEGGSFKAEVKDAGRPSEVEAVKARAGQICDLWKKTRGLSDEQKERRQKALEDLQRFIGAADREPGTIFDKAGA